MFLSVIIPVYNVSPYLRRCIDSVIAQDMKDEIELLLIDDGSTDDSGKMCDEYEKKYSWIHTYHIPNGGVGNARNYGLSRIKGDYFTFIDSDDFIDKGIYNLIHQLTHNEDIDIYTFGYKTYPNPEGNIHFLQKGYYQKESDLASFYLDLKKNYLCFSVINKVFKSLLFKNCRFETETHFYEDYLYVLSCLKLANSIYNIDFAPYNYVSHPGEHLGIKYTPPETVMKVAKLIFKRSKELPESRELSEYTIIEYYNNIIHAIDCSKGLKNKYKYINILLSEINKYGNINEFRTFLGRRKILLAWRNPLYILAVNSLRLLILKIR